LLKNLRLAAEDEIFSKENDKFLYKRLAIQVLFLNLQHIYRFLQKQGKNKQ
jgi:hypothetical protein